MDDTPQSLGNESRGSIVEPRKDLQPETPAGKIDKVDGRSSSHDPIKVAGEHLSRFHTLASTSGAAQKVRLGVVLFVKHLRDLFAQDNSSVSSTVSKILDDSRSVEKGFPGCSIVATVRSDGRKAESGGICQVKVLHASRKAAVPSTQESPVPILR
jgi:hypothetical protein